MMGEIARAKARKITRRWPLLGTDNILWCCVDIKVDDRVEDVKARMAPIIKDLIKIGP